MISAMLTANRSYRNFGHRRFHYKSSHVIRSNWMYAIIVPIYFFFAGYGNIYPKTDGGKIAAIFYAAFGIPLAMKVLAVLGKKLSIILKFIYVRLRRCCCCKIKERQKYKVTDKEKDATLELQEKGVVKIEQENPEDHVEQEVEERLPIALPVVILVIYILLGGLMYTFWEDWGYLDAFYFVFVSISTIGFGDITPAHTKYFMVTSLYVFVGLALVSMCINVIIDFYILSLKLAVHQMDVVKHKVADGCSCGSKRQKGIDQTCENLEWFDIIALR